MWGKAQQQEQPNERQLALATKAAEFHEHATQIERENGELRAQLAQCERDHEECESQLEARIAELRREVAFLRRELSIAEAKRDAHHERAVEAEDTLSIAARLIVEAAERSRAKAAAVGDEPPRGNEGAADLDELPSVVRQGPAEP